MQTKGAPIGAQKAKYLNRISINGKNNKKIVKIGKNNRFCGLKNDKLYYCKNNTYYSCKLNGLDLKKKILNLIMFVKHLQYHQRKLKFLDLV